LTCCGQRCPCYVESKACMECRCRGCRNPHRPGGHKVPFSCYVIAGAYIQGVLCVRCTPTECHLYYILAFILVKDSSSCLLASLNS
jgi:hypothetical protein